MHKETAKEKKYAAEQRKLQMLHAMAEQAQQEVIGCSENLFEKIDILGNSFIALLDKYIIDKQIKQQKLTFVADSTAAADSTPIPFIEYFPMSLLAEIHADSFNKGSDIRT